MAQSAHDLIADLDARLAKGELLEQDYHALRLRLLKELRLQGSPETHHFDPIVVKEVKDSRGVPFCLVPKGPYLHGAEDQLGTTKAGFFLSKYPVTVRDFITFVEATGYNYPDEEIEQMMLVSPGPDCPVSHISFMDAKEYCRWLRKTTREYYSLPHELEWEKAARGVDGRLYPWGNDDPGADHACFQGEKAYDSTMPVTRFNRNLSPYGCVDMVGNVWEFCLDTFDDPRDPRILRGGGWCNPMEYANCLARTFSYPPDKRIDFGGFRLLYLTADMLEDYKRFLGGGDDAEAKPKGMNLKVVRLDQKKAKDAAHKSGNLRKLAGDLEAAMARAASGQVRGASDVIVEQVTGPVLPRMGGNDDALAPAPIAGPAALAMPPTVGGGTSLTPPKPVVLTHKPASRVVPPRPLVVEVDEPAAVAPPPPAPIPGPVRASPPRPAAVPPPPEPEPAAAAEGEGKGEELNEYMAQIISNASLMYLRSKERRPAGNLKAMLRQGDSDLAPAPASGYAPAAAPSVVIGEPTPADDDVILSDGLMDVTFNPDNPVPMAQLSGEVDEVKAMQERRAARAAKRIGNSPAMTYGAFVLWLGAFGVALAQFVKHLTTLG